VGFSVAVLASLAWPTAAAYADSLLTPAARSITTVAGTGVAGFSGDGAPAVGAKLFHPRGVAVSATGTLYISDSGNNRVRKVVNPATPGQDVIGPFAGTGVAGFFGDRGPATMAKLHDPQGLAAGPGGTLFIADTLNNRVRAVSPNGVIKTVAGSGLCLSTVSNGVPAVQSSLCQPTGVAVDSSGKLYIADSLHHLVRVVNAQGRIFTFAGTGRPGLSGDGGPATRARLGTPVDVAVNARNVVFIADAANNDVRRVGPAGIITTFAGTGQIGASGDGGPATRARLDGPRGLGLDQLGDIYIADTGNNKVRTVDSRGIIRTFAGTGLRGSSGDGGPALRAELAGPSGPIAAGGTAVYFSDTGNQKVRGVFVGPAPALPETSYAILLPITAALIAGGAAVFVVYRRRRRVTQQ
jgi:sugar lactone lactonase YvrE